MTEQQTIAPWPIVGECFNRKAGHTCPQCDGQHVHVWVAWHNPDWASLGLSGPGLPVRCKTCGARKCDTNDCMLRRHHGEPHERY